jgi:hypothetical protein
MSQVVCVCVCVCERERERDSVQACLHVTAEKVVTGTSRIILRVSEIHYRLQ